MEYSLGIILISAFIMAVTAVTLPEDDVFICRNYVYTFGEPYGNMHRSSSFVLSPNDTQTKIKIDWPLVKMYMVVNGATFNICDTGIPTVDIVDYDDKDKGHFRVTRQGGSQAFGTISLNFRANLNIGRAAKSQYNANINVNDADYAE